MNDFQTIKADLLILRRQLIDYITEDDHHQDLMGRFLDVKEKEPEVYELLVLIYGEFKTHQTMSKKKLSSLVSSSIEIKVRTIDKLIIEQAKAMKNKPWYSKEPTWKDIWKGMASIAALVVFILLMYKWAPAAINDFTEDTKEITEVFKSKG